VPAYKQRIKKAFAKRKIKSGKGGRSKTAPWAECVKSCFAKSVCGGRVQIRSMGGGKVSHSPNKVTHSAKLPRIRRGGGGRSMFQKVVPWRRGRKKEAARRERGAEFNYSSQLWNVFLKKRLVKGGGGEGGQLHPLNVGGLTFKKYMERKGKKS